MAKKTTATDTPARRLLRLLLWKPGKQIDQSSFNPLYAGQPLDAKEFDAACHRLGVDDLPHPLDPSFERIIPLLQKSIDIVRDRMGSRWMQYPGLADIKADKSIRELPKADVPPFVLAGATALVWARRSEIEGGVIAQHHACHYVLEQMTLTAGLRKVPWPADLLNAFIATVAPPEGAGRAYHDRELAVVGDLLTRPGIPELLDETSRNHLPRIRPHLAEYTPTKLDRARLQAIDKVIAQRKSARAPESLFHEINPFARTANRVIAKLPKTQFAPFVEICRHASTCNPSRISKDWNAQACRLISAADAASLRSTLADLLSAILRQNPFTIEDPGEIDDYFERKNENEYRLLGLVCIAGLASDESLQNQLAEIIEASAKMPYRIRYRVQPLATAALRALSLAPSPPLHLLHRIKLRIKWPPVRKLIPKLITEAAAKSGLDPRDAEETTVPDFGLSDGRVTLPVGTHLAHIDATHSYHPTVTWRAKDGSTVPLASLKKSHPAAASAQRLFKDIQATLTTQRIRLELLLRETRTCPLAIWNQRYLSHGLLSPMVRRLIWAIDGVPVLFDGGSPRNIQGKSIKPSKSSSIALWHPISRPVEQVLAWRRRLEQLQITQPFKQAHREVYLLTDAERRTETYSNRFASHIVKAATLIAIAQARNWKVSLYGGATLDLPQFNLRAEFWSQVAEGITETRNRAWSGPPYLATDQVRFHRPGQTDPIPLADVPPLAFSEVMRDCDFFMSVSSVGVDPNWAAGRNARAREYWRQYSFGDLSETARTRRVVLERLLPRLSIAKRCKLDDKFLLVRGDLRTYKIHLGSGNILMEPNDQYLCIVPDQTAADATQGIILPFEGDTTLSIILSKALLLAADARIEDQSILRQIKMLNQPHHHRSTGG